MGKVTRQSSRKTELGTFGDKALEGAAEEDSQTTQCYHRNLVPSKSLGAVDTALKNTEETMFVRQRQVDLYEFEAILLCIVRVLGHPLLHGETLSQTNKRATK